MLRSVGLVIRGKRGKKKNLNLSRKKGKKVSSNLPPFFPQRRGHPPKKVKEYYDCSNSETDVYNKENEESAKKKKRCKDIMREIESILRNLTLSSNYRKKKVGLYNFSVLLGTTTNIFSAIGFDN